MELPAVLVMAGELLEETGLAAAGWTVKFEHAVLGHRSGHCNYGTKQIGLDVRAMLSYSEAQVREVILHELGHAKAGPAAEHGPVWAKAVRELGGKPAKLAPVVHDSTDSMKFVAILISLIVTGFYFGVGWGIAAIVVAVIALIPRIYRRFGPIEDVYKLNQP